MFEHDGYKDCLNDFFGEKDVPCCDCRGTAVGAERQNKPDLWAPKEYKKPINIDMVDHPPHYTSGDIECIDAMEAAFGANDLAAYCKIAAFKYIWRCELKGGVEDIKKARFYLDKYIKLKEQENDKG